MQQGYQQEAFDMFRSSWSSYSYEDLPSDLLGAIFACQYFDPNSTLTLSEQIVAFLNSIGATSPSQAPNWNDMPKSDSTDPPLARNYTTEPMYIQ